jgi:hypothetical protein
VPVKPKTTPKKAPAYKTASKKPAAPVVTVDEPTTAQRLAAAYATGNMALVAQVRTELGLSAPANHEGRDALTRTSRKAARR